MRLGLGIGLPAFVPRRPAGDEAPPALYGLSDDGEGGVLDELSTTPDFGWAEVDEVVVVTDEYTHLFNPITMELEAI